MRSGTSASPRPMTTRRRRPSAECGSGYRSWRKRTRLNNKAPGIHQALERNSVRLRDMRTRRRAKRSCGPQTAKNTSKHTQNNQERQPSGNTSGTGGRVAVRCVGGSTHHHVARFQPGGVRAIRNAERAVNGRDAVNSVGAGELELYALGRIRRNSEIAEVSANALGSCNQHVAALENHRVALVLDGGVTSDGNQRVGGLDDGRSVSRGLYPVSGKNRER